jgi:hypothetical protein
MSQPRFTQDLLRVQFWIGGVVLLGMLEMSVSYGDLDYLNKHGYRSRGLMVHIKLVEANIRTDPYGMWWCADLCQATVCWKEHVGTPASLGR